MQEIDNFILAYNHYLKKKTRIFSDVKLITKREGIGVDSFNNPIFYFLHAFDFPTMYNYSGFCFIDYSVPVSQDFLHFATHRDYNLLYVYCYADGKIYLWDQEPNRIEWSCSESTPIFFDAMSAVIQTKIKMVETGNYDLDQEYLRGVFQYCLNLNADKEEYSVFYEHILGIM